MSVGTSGYAWGSHDPLDLISTAFDANRSFSASGGLIGATAGAQIKQG